MSCCANDLDAVIKGHPECLSHLFAEDRVLILMHHICKYTIVKESPEVNAGKLACFKYLLPFYKNRINYPALTHVDLYQFVHCLEPCELLVYAYEQGFPAWTTHDGFTTFLEACYCKKAPAALRAAAKLGLPMMWVDGTTFISRQIVQTSNFDDVIHLSRDYNFYCKEMIECMVELGALWNPAGKDLRSAINMTKLSKDGSYNMIEHLLRVGCPTGLYPYELSFYIDDCFNRNPPDDLMKYPHLRNLIFNKVATFKVLLRHDGKELRRDPNVSIIHELEKVEKVMSEIQEILEDETKLPKDVIEHVMMGYL